MPSKKAVTTDVVGMIGKTAVRVAKTGLKLGFTSTKVYPPGVVLGRMSKGEARRLRKTLREKGHPHLAAAVRVETDHDH